MVTRQRPNGLGTGRLLVLAIGTFAVGVDASVLPGLLPRVAASLSVSVSAAGQLTTVFAVTYALGSPVIATLTGRADRRVVIGAGLAAYLAGLTLQAAGPSYPVVLVGRVVAALGAAAFQANAYAVAAAMSPPARRARSLAVIAMGTSLAAVLGVPFGLLIGQWQGWRGALWTVAALAAVAAVLAVAALPSVMLPATTFRARLAVLVTPRILVLLVASALVLAPLFMVNTYTAVIVGLSMPGSGAVLIALVVFGIGFFAGNRVVGSLTDRFGPLTALTAGLVATTVALTALAAVQHWFIPAVAALFASGGAGAFLFIPQQNRVLTASGDLAPVAIALSGSMNYLGTAIGAVAGGVVLSAAGAAWLVPAAVAGAVAVLAVTWLTAPERRTEASRAKRNERDAAFRA